MDYSKEKSLGSSEISRLSEREAMLRESLGLEDVWAWEYTEDEGRLRLSPETLTVLGDRVNPFQAFLALVRLEDRFRISHAILRSLRSHRGFILEGHTVRHPSYPELKIQIQGHYVKDSQGNLFRGFVQNISQVRSISNAPEDDRFHSLFNQSAVGVVYGNIDGTIIDANAKFSALTGYGRDEIVGTSIYRFTHTEDLPHSQSEHIRLRENKFSQSFVEKRYVHKDGHLFWVQVSSSAVTGANGRPRYFLGIVQDIDERKKAEAAIKRSEENFRLLSESIPQVVWMGDADSNVTYFNRQWTEYTGLTLEESLGLKWLENMHPEDRERLINEQHEDYSGPEHPWIEVVQRLKTKDGNYRWFLSRAVAVYNDKGEVQQWIGSATDIDAQKKIEQELDEARMLAIAASEAKSAFLANMSHEIRTPLGVILGYCELLKREGISPELQREFLTSMMRNGKELSALIDNILDLSKIEAEKMELNAKPILIRDQIEAIVQGLRIKAQEKHIDLSTFIHADVPAIIVSDEIRLRQILINLVGNAIKFTDHGHITLGVKTSDIPGEIIIDIRDTGCGMEVDQTKRLFKAFSQVDATSTRRHGGTGLGLMLSKLLAKALGGDVVLLETKPGIGSTFRVSILSQPGEAPLDKTPVMERPAPVDHNLHGIKILLAEDALDNQFIFSTFLRAEGAKVTVVENGQEAVKIGLAESFDIVLMDIQMPIMDGYDATRFLRAGGFSGPVLALSAHALTEDSAKSKLAGCDDHISKPVDFERLLTLIQDHVQKVSV